VSAVTKPAELRQLVFGMAAESTLAREEILRLAADRLDVSTGDIVRSLFADRAGERVLSPPVALPSAFDVVRAYNLSLLQGLLASASAVRIRLRERVAEVARHAKSKGLIALFSIGEGETIVDLSGPIALFHHTTKYARALAAFLPAVLGTRGWKMVARCEVGEESRVLRASASDSLARPALATRLTEPAACRSLVRELKKLRTDWAIERDPAAYRWEGGLLFPDLVLRRGDREVLVEIAGFYTEGFLRKKLRELDAAALSNVVLCLDESLACSDGGVTSPVLHRFHGRIDARRLLEVAERIAQRRDDGAMRRRAGP
jgi:predicted nuclease of restriction endonuclease-like RecB superfamily